jgi:hypothetical protein
MIPTAYLDFALATKELSNSRASFQLPTWILPWRQKSRAIAGHPLNDVKFNFFSFFN